MSVTNSSSSMMLSSIVPQLYRMMNLLVQEIGMLSQSPQLGGAGINMGPSSDTTNFNNNIFSGSLPGSQSPYGSQSPNGSPSQYGGYGSSQSPYGSQSPTGSPYGSQSQGGCQGGGMSPTATGGTTPTDTGGTPTAGGGTPTPTAGGGATPTGSSTGSSYVDNMIKALKQNGAPQDLIDAYMHQYQLLGLIPGGGGTGGGTTPTGGGGATPTPTGGGYGPTATGGGYGPTPTGGGTPTPTGGGGGAPSPITPVSGGGATSPELSGSGKVNWATAPDNLKKLQPYIQKASAATGTPEAIIAGTIWQESGGRVDVSATDGGTDQGLMQIDNTTYDKEVAGQNGLPHGTTPTDPAQNIMAGATYLAMMKQKFGSWDLALRGYNSGENGVDVHDPNARPAGTGDPTYVISIRQHVTNLENGTPLANR